MYSILKAKHEYSVGKLITKTELNIMMHYEQISIIKRFAIFTLYRILLDTEDRWNEWCMQHI